MSMLTTSTSWNVGRVSSRCAACGTELPATAACWATLVDGGMAPRHAEEKPDDKKSKKPDEKPAAGVSPFVRVDFCEPCWNAGKRPDQLSPEALGLDPAALPAGKAAMFSYWRTTVPVPQQKKKLLVDDSVLMDVFTRMEGKTEPQEVRFRFVLALILMRKRLLRYEGMDDTPPALAAAAAEKGTKPPELWRMTPRKFAGAAADSPDSAAAPTTVGWADAPVHVINPHLTEEQIAEVSQQLSAILAEEV